MLVLYAVFALAAPLLALAAPPVTSELAPAAKEFESSNEMSMHTTVEDARKDQKSLLTKHLDAAESKLNSKLFQYPLSTVEGWSYDEQDKWEGQCATGQQQSPVLIDLRNIKMEPREGPLRLDWPKVDWATMFNDGTTLKVLGNLSQCKTYYNGNEYSMEYVKFHHESEHVIQRWHDGFLKKVQFPLEAEFVHSGASGKLVISVMFKLGNANQYLNQQLMWTRLDLVTEGAHRLMPTIGYLSSLVLDETAFFVYEGSMTTPPCNEKVTRIVMRVQPEVSLGQTIAFPYVADFRPIQPLNGRVIEYFCGGDC